MCNMPVCHTGMGAEREEKMSGSSQVKQSTRKEAKGAGVLEKLSLCREAVATLFGSAAQAASIIISIHGLPSAWGSFPAPAYATGFLRSALSVEAVASGFLKPMRMLTKHIKLEYPVLLLWRQMAYMLP